MRCSTTNGTNEQGTFSQACMKKGYRNVLTARDLNGLDYKQRIFSKGTFFYLSNGDKHWHVKYSKRNPVKKILQINSGVLIANKITIHKRDALTLKEPQK